MAKKKKKRKKDLFKKIIWFEKRISYDIDFFELLQPQRIVSSHPRYLSGKFYSEKCGREIQYESGLELDFIRFLEKSDRVRFYFEQPVQVRYWRGRRKQTYTPDFGVLLDTNEFVIVEVKDLAGMAESKVQMRIEGLLDFCSQRGFGLLLTNGKETIEKINKTRRNRPFEKAVLRAVESQVLRKRECRELMKTHQATQNELLKIILKNNLQFNSYPFKLQRGNTCEVFRHVFIDKKKYEDYDFFKELTWL
ncbi:MAG: hypothetical protein LUG51_16855 [Tannerellaceae bacterium]|nr:hypothetical protein [Tannerellaceae bacterium]